MPRVESHIVVLLHLPLLKKIQLGLEVMVAFILVEDILAVS